MHIHVYIVILLSFLQAHAVFQGWCLINLQAEAGAKQHRPWQCFGRIRMVVKATPTSAVLQNDWVLPILFSCLMVAGELLGGSQMFTVNPLESIGHPGNR